jgi:hypothetical protein
MKEHPDNAYEYLAPLPSGTSLSDEIVEEGPPWAFSPVEVTPEVLARRAASKSHFEELWLWHAYCVEEKLAEIVDLPAPFGPGKTIVITSLGELALSLHASRPLPPNGATVKPEDVPPQCRELGHTNGHILDAPYLAGNTAWDINSKQCGQAFDAGELTYRIKVCHAYCYRFDELDRLRKRLRDKRKDGKRG